MPTLPFRLFPDPMTRRPTSIRALGVLPDAPDISGDAYRPRVPDFDQGTSRVSMFRVPFVSMDPPAVVQPYLALSLIITMT